MSAEVYQMISMVAFGCGGILTLIAIILFIKFDVPSLIGELSGRTAEKKVQEIREQNRQAVSMRQRGSERRRKVPAYATDTKDVIGGNETASKTAEEKKAGGVTAVAESKTQIRKPIQSDEATTALDEATTALDEATAVLDEATAVLDEATAVLGNEGTTLLNEGDNESFQAEPQTTLLSEKMAEEQTTILSEATVWGDADFSMVQDVVEVHTDETI